LPGGQKKPRSIESRREEPKGHTRKEAWPDEKKETQFWGETVQGNAAQPGQVGTESTVPLQKGGEKKK